jgi:uncharacterized membrane protein required for colicin V production
MEWLAETSAFDVLVLAIFLAFLARGIWIGFIRQISSLLAMLCSPAILITSFIALFYPILMIPIQRFS